MMFGHHPPKPARPRTGALRVVVLIAVLSTGLLAPSGVAQAATTVPLGATDRVATPAGSTITNTGPSTLTGDVGLPDGRSVTGLDDITRNASLHVADGVALQAKAFWVLMIALVLFIATAFSYRSSRR